MRARSDGREATVAEVAERVAAAVDAFHERGLAAALGPFLVSPRRCTLVWDYAEADDPDPSYPAFVVAERSGVETAIVYSEHGFGPDHRWGLVSLVRLESGMDSEWFDTLEQAVRDARWARGA